jgi:glycosyltransferase involved in cell wall biosynthesis
MKNIFLESHNLNNLYFGFGQFNYHLIKALSEIENRDYEITLHSKNIEWLKKEFNTKFKYRKYYTFTRMPLFRIRKKYDLWHSMNQNTKIEPYHKIPYLLTIHNISFFKDPNNYKHLKNNIAFQEKINRSNAIAYISNFAKESTHLYFDVPKVPEFVIYNGNPIRQITLDDSFKPRYLPVKPYLFSIGQISERKNFISLIRMMEKINDFELIIAGKKTTEESLILINEISKLKLENKITLVGEINENEKQYYYKNCEAFVFPSLREGFGLPVIEAMKFGKPVFISNNTSLPEIGGTIANYWDNYDADYMVNVLHNGLNEYYKNTAENKTKLIERSELFSWEKAAKDYNTVYKSMLHI